MSCNSFEAVLGYIILSPAKSHVDDVGLLIWKKLLMRVYERISQYFRIPTTNVFMS